MFFSKHFKIQENRLALQIIAKTSAVSSMPNKWEKEAVERQAGKYETRLPFLIIFTFSSPI